jgi:hypothetical protein
VNEDEIVRQAIWDHLPELRESFVEFEREHAQDDLETGYKPYIGAYSLVSDVLVHPYLLPLIDDADSDQAALMRCTAAIEQILEARSERLNDLIGIRVNSPLLRKPERWRRLRQYAGPLFKECVLYDSQYRPWPFDEPVV